MPAAIDASSSKVFAIVVTFFPNANALNALLESLLIQVNGGVVVDNTPGDSARITEMLCSSRERFPWLQLVALGENRGIAAAQNLGIRMAIDQGYGYVLLSDQDSRPDASMVAALLATTEELQAMRINVGCVCPAYFDEVTGQAFRFQVQPPGRIFYSTLPGDQAMPWVEIVSAISSGSLIPTATLRAVGGMREDFFIDDVDTEWCHRARAKGFTNFGTARASLVHRLGDAPFRIWWFGWREMSEYSTTRLYYRFRNFVLMARLQHVPWRWCVRAAWYWMGNLYAHCFFASRRRENAKAIARGLRDGWLGRSGPMPAP